MDPSKLGYFSFNYSQDLSKPSFQGLPPRVPNSYSARSAPPEKEAEKSKSILKSYKTLPPPVKKICRLISSDPQFTGAISFFTKKLYNEIIIDPPDEFLLTNENEIVLQTESKTRISIFTLDNKTLSNKTGMFFSQDSCYLNQFKKTIFYTSDLEKDKSHLVICKPANKQFYYVCLNQLWKNYKSENKQFVIIACFPRTETDIIVVTQQGYILKLDLTKDAEKINSYAAIPSISSYEVTCSFEVGGSLCVQIRDISPSNSNPNQIFIMYKLADFFAHSKQIPSYTILRIPNEYNQKHYVTKNRILCCQKNSITCYSLINSNSSISWTISGTSNFKIYYADDNWSIVGNYSISYFGKLPFDSKPSYSYILDNSGKIFRRLDSNVCLAKIYNNILFEAKYDSLELTITFLLEKHDPIILKPFEKYFQTSSEGTSGYYIKDISLLDNICYCLVGNKKENSYNVFKFQLPQDADNTKMDTKHDK